MAAVAHTFEVKMISSSMAVQVNGHTLGDLRKAIHLQFDIPPFEQNIIYFLAGESVVLEGDDSVLMQEKGLFEVAELTLTRQIDPRFKMEKETAFLEALAACRFGEATEILKSSGFSIDPNCVRKGSMEKNVAVSDSPCSYRLPALTVAMISGMEHAVESGIRISPDKIQAWMSREKEVCEIVKFLIQNRADVNAVGDEDQDCESAGGVTVHGKTPLCAAVQRGSPALVRMLLDARADPNHTMKYGQSAWGPDRSNPFGPGVLKPESFLGEVSNGSANGKRDKRDPRNQFSEEIRNMLRGEPAAASGREPAASSNGEPAASSSGEPAASSSDSCVLC